MKALFTLCALLLLCAGGAEAATPSTAQPGVSLITPLLDMPGLQRKRQLRIYLPPGYASSGKRYPVLYMHDAQNLFDRATAYAGEWQVDETLDALARAGKLELIVVGIDNGLDKRMTELNPWDSAEFGAGEGKQYMDFIVQVVKPMIDVRYRTKPDRINTGVMGSSMGGLISHYAIGQYPQVFGKAGIFSPSYAYGAGAFTFAAAKPALRDARLYLLMGQLEGGAMVPDVQRMHAQLLAAGHPPANEQLAIVAGGDHNEAFWGAQFGKAVLWLFAPEK